MAVIQTYDQRVLPQGQLDVQASPNAFGANVGAAMQGVGNAMRNFAETLQRNEIESDVTNIHVEMAKKRAEWQQKLVDLTNETKPGDDTFAPRVQKSIQDDLAAFGDTIKTRQGQQTFARMSADMAAMFGQEAVGIQSRLTGEYAKVQANTLFDSLGTVAAQDHTQWQSLVKQGLDAINDPNGKFAKIPEPTREAFRQTLTETIKYDAAKGFARRFPNAVLSAVPPELRAATQAAAADQPRPGLPPDLKASDVAPYTQDKIDSRAKMVAQPSPYDKTFQAAAQMYNLDWRELKMRAVAESGLNPTAVSSKNAGGLMQLTPETARQLGVDRNDPVASIFAAAKLVADYRTKANGDMAKVDMMYYGGESGKAWGPNTNQYAANLAALRQAVGLGSSVDPSAFAPNATVQTGNSQGWKTAKTGIDFIDTLPPDKFFAVMTEAEHYQRAYDSQSERARLERKHQEQTMQEATMDSFMQRIIAPTPENGGKLDELTIVRNSTLTSQQKEHMIDVLNARTRELTSRAEPKTNPEAVRELTLRIHAPDDSPDKIYNNDALYQALKDRRISTSEYQFLDRQVRELKDGSTNGFAKDVNNARNLVYRTLQQNVMLQGMEMAAPGTIADIAYRFDRDMEAKIDALRKQNKDPRVLLDPSPGNSQYILRPEYIQSFVPSGAATLSTAAAKVAQGQASGLPTYKDFDKLPKGATFTDPQGNIRVKP